jgi:hypothetical protein
LLSDDIPPPSAEERAAPGGDEGPTLFQDLELTPPSPDPVRFPPRPRPETEEQRLRRALQHVLEELEAIKALLRHGD